MNVAPTLSSSTVILLGLLFCIVTIIGVVMCAIRYIHIAIQRETAKRIDLVRTQLENACAIIEHERMTVLRHDHVLSSTKHIRMLLEEHQVSASVHRHLSDIEEVLKRS
jgi:hypothetical protein